MIDQETLQAIQEQFKQHMEAHPLTGDRQNIVTAILETAQTYFSDGELRGALRHSGALDCVKRDLEEWSQFFEGRKS